MNIRRHILFLDIKNNESSLLTNFLKDRNNKILYDTNGSIIQINPNGYTSQYDGSQIDQFIEYVLGGNDNG